MFLTKLFKKTRAKVMVALAGLTMIFGAGAAISSGVAAATNNEVVETKAAATKTYIVYSGSNTYVYAYGGTGGEVFGTWGGQQMISDNNGKYAEASGVPSHVIFHGSSKTGDLEYDSSKPFYDDDGARDLDTSKMLYIYSSNASLNGKAFAYDSDTATFSYTTASLAAGTTIKFYCQTYRTDWHSGKALTGLSLAYEGADYVVSAAGSFTFTCTLQAYGTYGNITHGMTSTFTPLTTYSVTKYRVLSDTMVATNIGSESVESGNLPTQPSYDGYNFYGWFGDAACTLPVSSVTSAGNIYALMYKQGYYLVGDSTFTGSSSTAWNITGAILPTSLGDGYVATWTNVTIANAAQFKVGYYEANEDFTMQNNGFSGRHLHFTWATTYAEHNIVCGAAGTYNIYLTEGSWQVAIRQEFNVDYYEVKDDNTTKLGTTTGDTDTLLSVTLDGKFSDYTGYSVKYYSNAECTTEINLASTYTEASMSVYAKYTLNTYTITYYRVFNGTLMNWWGTATIQATHGQAYSDLEPESPEGYGFEGWYSDAECKHGIGSQTITSTPGTTRYAKFTTLATNKIIYLALPNGSYADQNITYGAGVTNAVRLRYYKDSTHFMDDGPVQYVNGVTSIHLFMASVPVDCEYFFFHCGKSGSDFQNGHRTFKLTLSDAGSDNLFICDSTAGTDPEPMEHETQYGEPLGDVAYGGTWATCYFQFQTSSTSDFTTKNVVDMSTPSNMSTGNDAETIGFSTSANDYFRVAVVVNGIEDYISTVGGDEHTLAVITAAGTNRFKSATTVNVYLKNNVIYLIDSTDIDNGGHLYISTSSALTDIKITVSIKDSNNDEVYPFSSAKLSTVTNVSSTSTLTFNSITGMVCIPIYNLRGDMTPDATKQDYYSVTFNSNPAVNVPIVTDKTDYYMSSLSATPTTTNAASAACAYDIDAAIGAAVSGSVCNIDQKTAETLCESYDANKSNTLLTGASIITYNYKMDAAPHAGKDDMISNGSKGPISMVLIRERLGIIAGGKYAPASARYVGPTNGQSPLTMTLWIVLGCGIAGLGAIGAAYFVSKKKKRPQA